MSSPPPLLGPSILRHLRTLLLLVYYLWTSFHQPQSLRISAGVRQGEIWSLTVFSYCSCHLTFLILMYPHNITPLSWSHDLRDPILMFPFPVPPNP
ncbi:hypothetical protein EV363DRAFT_1186190 [Boletus edulis]|nr:hypothetical protein EV363DRAFT_1186190 [Boletus edulis]